jgi:hypothetical protein
MSDDADEWVFGLIAAAKDSRRWLRRCWYD